jgi:hypothetical protein
VSSPPLDDCALAGDPAIKKIVPAKQRAVVSFAIDVIGAFPSWLCRPAYASPHFRCRPGPSVAYTLIEKIGKRNWIKF